MWGGGARVATVDGLRGLCALVVMGAHICNSAGDPRYIGMANVSVLGFFVISGYVLTLNWRGGMPSFLVRRIVRLWPLYAVCIGVGGWLAMQPPGWDLWLWSPTQLFEDEQPLQDPVTWSLFVEVWAMPFMPLIVWISARRLLLISAVAALLSTGLVDSPLYYGAFFLIGGALRGLRPVSPFLERAAVQWLGRVSYSLYLTHVIVIGALKFHAPDYWLWLALPCCLATAQLAWMLIEAPSLKLSRWAGEAMDRGLAGFARRPAMA